MGVVLRPTDKRTRAGRSREERVRLRQARERFVRAHREWTDADLAEAMIKAGLYSATTYFKDVLRWIQRAKERAS